MKPSARKRQPLETANGQRSTPSSTCTIESFTGHAKKLTLPALGTPYSSNPTPAHTPPPMPQGQYTDPPPPKRPAPMSPSLSKERYMLPFQSGYMPLRKSLQIPAHVLNLLGPPPQNILQSQEAPSCTAGHQRACQPKP